MSFTPSERKILRTLECEHTRCVPNDALPPDLAECLDCGGIVKPKPKRKPKKRRR